MPGQPTIRPFRESDVPSAAELFAARHARDSARVPNLEPALATAQGARPLIEPLNANPRSDGVVAEVDGRISGFLFGERMDLAPTDMASLFIPPHSIAIPIEGHAVAADTDPTLLYRAMYGVLASEWTTNGYFVHRAAITPGDAGVQEAWVSLGFGRYLTAATRTTSPVAARGAAGIDIERASPEDIDDVIALAGVLNNHHWHSPMFWPILPETQDSARQFNLAALRSADMPYFVAYQKGTPIAMQTFLKPGFTPPIVARENDVYLFEGVVSDDARGGGIGTAVLSHAMAWARDAGFQTCTLHFASANPTGGPFWLGHRFIPVEHTMERRIDGRIAWARPR